MSKLSIFILIILYVGRPVFAMDNAEAVADILNRKAVLAQEFEFPNDFQIEFQFFLAKEIASNEQIARLKQAAKSDPSAAARLERVLSENELGGTRQRIVLYYGGEDKWRTNNDLENRAIIPSTDMAKNGSEGYWSLTGRQLQTAEAVDDDNRFNPELHFGLCYSWTRSLLYGIMWNQSSDFEVGRVEISGDRAIARVEVSGLSYEVTLVDHGTGDWVDANIVRVDVFDSATNQVSATAVFKDWHQSEVLGSYIAGKQLVYVSNNALESELTLVSALPLEFEIDQLVQTPEADGVDILRGQSTFTSINNYSGGSKSRIDESTREVISVVKSDSDDSDFGRFVLLLLVLSGAVLLVVLLKKKTE